MEGVPKFENTEAGSDWRNLKEDAPQSARLRIEEIEGFKNMTAQEQLQALHALIEALASDNKNRFVASEVARQRAIIEEDERHTTRMSILVRAR